VSITFVGMNSRSSGKVRGLQLAEIEKNFNFFDTDSGRFFGKNFFQEKVIFLRRFKPNLAKELKNKGLKIGYDVIDRPVAELHDLQKRNPEADSIDWKVICHDLIDFYIVTNTLAKQSLSLVTNKKIYVIPHHTVSNELIQKDTSNISTIGYLGTKDQLYKREIITDVCFQNKLNFYENHPADQKKCIEDLKKIDIGVVYLEKNKRTDYVLKFKPNQKLSNFQCFGIPSVVVPYESYVEFGGKDSFLIANNEKELADQLNKLISDVDLRKRIQKNGYEAAKNLLVNKVIKSYSLI